MKRILLALLFIAMFVTIAFSQFDDTKSGWDKGAFYVPAGTVYSEGLIVADESTLSAETLDEVGFDTNIEWDITGDFADDEGVNIIYSWVSTTTSTLTQVELDLAVTGTPNVWYVFTYTIAVTTPFDGNGAVSITTGFALTAVDLDITVGTHTVYFLSAVNPADFVISVVSGDDSEGTWTIDDVTLKQIDGGNVHIAGALYIKGIDISSAVSPTTLELGTIDGTSIGITSDGGADDVVLPQANTTEAGLLSAAKWDEIEANTLKDTNVSTDLSEGTSTETTVDVNSSDGNNATLVSASGTRAGVLTKAKWDEIVANNDKNTNVPTELSTGTNNTTELSVTSDGGADDWTIPVATTSVAGIIISATYNDIVANTLAVATQTTTDETVTTLATIAIATDEAYLISVHVVGMKNDQVSIAGVVFEALYCNNGGTVTLTGAVNYLHKEVPTDWDIVPVISGTDVLVKVNAIAATSVNWKSSIRILTVG